MLLDFGVSWVLCCDCWVLGCCGLMWVAGGWFGLGLVDLVDFVVLAACWFAGLAFRIFWYVGLRVWARNDFGGFFVGDLRCVSDSVDFGFGF